MKSILKLPFIFLFMSVFLFGFSFYNYSSNSSGVYCKDCGSEQNCWQGSGLDQGYQDCYIVYDDNGEPDQCSVSGWGGCQKYHYPE